MRKLYFVLFGLVLLLAGLVVAQAANPFNVQGTFTAIDYDAKTLTVQTEDEAVYLYATDNTVVVIAQVTATFDQLVFGNYVKVQTIGDMAIKICVPINQTPK